MGWMVEAEVEEMHFGMDGGAWSQGVWVPLAAGKGQETASPLGPPEGTRPADTHL